MIRIETYQNSDFQELVRCTRLLQEYIGNLDTLGRERTGNAFDAESYAKLSLKESDRDGGIILLAKDESKVVGFLVASLYEASTYDTVECFTQKDGKIYELFVDENYRGQKVGLELMQKAEAHFHDLGCDAISIECFIPNTHAHTFYEKLGYEDRLVSMLKKL